MDAKAPVRGIGMRENSSRDVYPGWLKVGFWVCVVIAVAVVLRRVVVLAHPTPVGAEAGSPTAALDAVFASHAALTLAHILPAMAFVLLCPFVLLRRFSAVWAERLFFPLGAWVGVTAYAMSSHPVGGWIERSAVLLFNSLFLFSLARAFVAMRRGEALEKMRWMLRAVAILLGIATTRPVMGVFFATSRLTHLEPAQFFGVAFWIGFSINTIAIELWLRSRGDWLPVAG
ncbi:DUF2306 domain-containing protein [Tunturiibacter lichenicola]|jgi:hypothetical protein|uniref:DUF2306 domain-containing protein n=1 Tax=Tunturiibacter lichenicola TaxID=2051959 RepID=UPI003D9AC338